MIDVISGARPARVAALLCLGAIACADADRSAGQDAPPQSSPDGQFVQRSSNGTEVRLTLDPTILTPGPVRLAIAVDHEPDLVLPVTLDLVSPEMPMHGVLRYETTPGASGEYVADIEVPMEGFWELYVNLDYGADAAVFELEVAPGEGGHEHGGPPSHLDHGDSSTPAHHERQGGGGDSDHEAGHAGDGDQGSRSHPSNDHGSGT